MFVIIYVIKNLTSKCLSVSNAPPPKWVFQSQQKFYSPLEVALGVHRLSFILGNAL